MNLNAIIPLLLVLQCSWSVPMDQFYPFDSQSDRKFSNSQSPQRVKLSGDAGTYSTAYVSLKLY